MLGCPTFTRQQFVASSRFLKKAERPEPGLAPKRFGACPAFGARWCSRSTRRAEIFVFSSSEDVWEGFGAQAVRPWVDPRVEDLRLKKAGVWRGACLARGERAKDLPKRAKNACPSFTQAEVSRLAARGWQWRCSQVVCKPVPFGFWRTSKSTNATFAGPTTQKSWYPYSNLSTLEDLDQPRGGYPAKAPLPPDQRGPSESPRPVAPRGLRRDAGAGLGPHSHLGGAPAVALGAGVSVSRVPLLK